MIRDAFLSLRPVRRPPEALSVGVRWFRWKSRSTSKRG